MSFYRRRLPHWIPDRSTVFVTWRLAGSLPRIAANTSPRGVLEEDQTLDQFARGPMWLRDPRIATIVANALRYGETVGEFYHLHAWVIMPNHVHVVWEPRIAQSSILQWLNGRTSRVANRILGRTGLPFWQDESFDHWVRSSGEFQDLIEYVETNPVRAKLAETAEQWPWSSKAAPHLLWPASGEKWQTTKTDRPPHA
jgi:hypothetical protein